MATRRWTLVAWAFLGFGQLLGAHWAYVEVGWGGYYAWDPVENAALMPWLAATAFLHSVMIQERKGMLKVWNMVLVALAFELSVFGTFLTRSGVVNSIHSFAKSPIGSWFLGVRGHLDGLLARADHVAAAATEGPHQARVGVVARGRVPLQQPAARRAVPDGALGRPVPDPDAVREGRDAHHRQAVLRLLPASLRSAASAADGHRPPDRLAEDERARARADTRVADRRDRPLRHRTRCRRRRLVEARADRLHLLGLRPRVDRARAGAGHTRHRLGVHPGVAEPPPLRRLHRARRDRAPRDRHRRVERLRQIEGGAASSPARARRSAATRSPFAGCTVPRLRTRSRHVPSSP